MTSESIAIYRDSFSGTINLSDLKPAGSLAFNGQEWSCFKCPCGGSNHVATRAGNYDTGRSVTASPVLHCWETGQQWMIRSDIETIIHNEEKRYGALLDRFARLADEPVGADEAFRLWSEQGAPLDILDVTEPERFNQLIAAHRQKSRGN